MPPSSSDIRKTVDAYLGRDHVTCSAVVIDRRRRVLHIRHRTTGLVLTPGGHIEPGDRTLLAAALREVAEEVGITPGPPGRVGNLVALARFLQAVGHGGHPDLAARLACHAEHPTGAPVPLP
ncbi:NUDIX domain-containing protein [Streptomyces sp. NPDC051132]|uniref:NUDIX domain-containing protein n=1 Tax=unclassified Streptomyces TaxID=2593676 RepID=UPI0034313446